MNKPDKKLILAVNNVEIEATVRVSEQFVLKHKKMKVDNYMIFFAAVGYKKKRIVYLNSIFTE